MPERGCSYPHRRYNPLTGRWVLVSPHRLDRPWQGETVAEAPPARKAYDPRCYLCPGNVRANGARNPHYAGAYVFQNDYAALLPQLPDESWDRDGLLVARSERGECRVLCFSPRHDADIPSLDLSVLRNVVDAWAGQYAQLGALPYVGAVTIFENRGTMMGASNPHPHGQIWANESIPNELDKESRALLAHRDARGECLLCAYARLEIERGERVVYADECVCVLVPFWAEWPFEALVLPRRHVRSLVEAQPAERDAIAAGMRDLTSRYDKLFGVPFPYSMGWHQAPVDGEPHEYWHAHAHYYPPLLRSAHVRKYAVGYEMLAQPQRDLTPERAVRLLLGR